MIYIETGSKDVFYDLAAEYYFAVEHPLDEPVFLFWQTTPTIVVGKYQNTLEEINRDYVEAHNIQVVRRLSGGGTVYADLGNWMYTFITYGDADEIQFHKYLAPIIAALGEIGVKAEFTGRNDLVVDGKKVSGTSQYKLKGNTVHHGTLLFNEDIEQMVASTNVDAEKFLSKSIKSVRQRVTNISEHLPAPMDIEEFKDRMVAAILGDGKRYCMTEADKARVNAIADEMFRPWERRYGSDPKSTMTNSARFAGGKVEVHLDVSKGVIRSARLSGDFFASEKADGLTERLIGCRYDRASVRACLGDLADSIYGVTPDELIGLIVP